MPLFSHFYYLIKTLLPKTTEGSIEIQSKALEYFSRYTTDSIDFVIELIIFIFDNVDNYIISEGMLLRISIRLSYNSPQLNTEILET